MTTLYLSPRYTEDSQLLWKAAVQLGWDVQRLSWSIMDHLEPTEVKERVIYGESTFTAMAAEKLRISLVSPPSDFLYQMPRKFSNRKILHFIYNGYHGFNSCLDLIADEIPTDWYNLKGPLFVKPVEKGVFQAAVYDNPVAQIKNLPSGTQVIVSEPVEWEVEFRCFVSGRKVTTVSPYSRLGQIENSATELEWKEAEAFGNRVAEHYGFPHVLDVGYIRDRGWSVVEANGAWGSGIYNCDVVAALTTIKKACRCKA